LTESRHEHGGNGGGKPGNHNVWEVVGVTHGDSRDRTA
jgi:hypothetical protein